LNRLAADERRALMPVGILLLVTVAGLSLALAGFVLNHTVVVVAGIALVLSASVITKRMTKAGEPCG
jgi:NAD/NADP transhydrogenase beta subunit